MNFVECMKKNPNILMEGALEERLKQLQLEGLILNG